MTQFILDAKPSDLPCEIEVRVDPDGSVHPIEGERDPGHVHAKLHLCNDGVYREFDA